MPIGPRRRRQFVLLTIALIGLVGFLVGEALVRIFLRYNTPDTVRENSLSYRPTAYARHMFAPDQDLDLDRAWGLKSEADRTHRSYRINEYGFRGPSFPLDKPEGSCRLVVLGGSSVFDLHASEGRDWPRLLEAELRNRGVTGIEVINGGVPGHATADSLGRLVTRVWSLEPDVVLLYNAWNDLKYFGELSPANPLIGMVAPHDPDANPFQNYRGSLDRWLSMSQLYVKLRNLYFLNRWQPGLEGGETDRELKPTYGDFGVQQYRLNVELIVDASRNLGALPVLLTQASLVAASTPEDARQRIAYGFIGLTHEALVRALGECNGVLRAVAQEKAVGLIDVADLSGRPDLFADHIHTTATGSETLARRIAEPLATLLPAACRVGGSRSSV